MREHTIQFPEPPKYWLVSFSTHAVSADEWNPGPRIQLTMLVEAHDFSDACDMIRARFANSEDFINLTLS